MMTCVHVAHLGGGFNVRWRKRVHMTQRDGKAMRRAGAFRGALILGGVSWFGSALFAGCGQALETGAGGGDGTAGEALHTLEVYGFEDCCDGAGRVEYAAPGMPAYAPITKTAFDTCGGP